MGSEMEETYNKTQKKATHPWAVRASEVSCFCSSLCYFLFGVSSFLFSSYSGDGPLNIAEQNIDFPQG